MSVAIISIGDELLIGQTVNTNAAYLGEQLSLQGYEISEVRSIRDTSDAIKHVLDDLIPLNNILLVTGGLGPTEDDLTISTVADYFDTQLDFHDETYQRLCSFLKRIGREPLERHRLQAYLPVSAHLFINNRGTAPGMRLAKGNCLCYFMPGVPYEMKALMEDQILPDIKSHFPLEEAYSVRTFLTAGVGETLLEDRVKSAVGALPSFMSIAYLPSMGLVKIRLSGRHRDRYYLEEVFEESSMEIVNALGSDCYGLDDMQLEEVVVAKLHEKNLNLSLAESCTAGNISARLVNVAGLSNVFPGAYVCYSYEWKEAMLDVQNSILEEEGAVSEACIRAMLDGLLTKEGCNIGLAISGILGPTGATPDKPIGTVYMGVGFGKIRLIRRFQGVNSRLLNKELFTNYALNMLRCFIDEL